MLFFAGGLVGCSPCGMRDLSSLTRDRTHAPSQWKLSPDHWTVCIFEKSPPQRTPVSSTWHLGELLSITATLFFALEMHEGPC